MFCGCCARGCYPIAAADYSRGEFCRRAQCAEFRSARCDRLRATLSGVSLGVGDSPAAGDGSRRIGRIPLARVVWDARGPLPVGACREGPVRRLVAWAAFRRQGGLPGKADGETGAASGLMRVHVSSVGGRGFSREWGAVFVDDCRCAAWTSSVRGMAMDRGNSAGIEKERGP